MEQAGFESRFQILERLGRGGTAEVFRARQVSSGRDLALKRPLPEPPPGIDFTALASREVTLIAGRRFPGLVRIYNSPQDPCDALLLELCTGQTLDHLGKISDLHLALNLLTAIAADLAYLAHHRIIHGDLKPQNIFLPADLERCKSGRLFYAKLSDFSLGRFVQEPDSSRVGLGTVGYMAPETIIDSRASLSSDLFAFGVIAYQALAGFHPFAQDETDPLRINARVREEQPTPLDQLLPGFPKPLAELVTALLHKQPEHRPASPLAVCRLLRQVGSTYPFELLLRPKYALESVTTYSDALTSIAGLSERQADKMSRLTDGSLPRLRHLLELNFRKNVLSFDDPGLRLTRDLYWPSRYRRRTLAGFSAFSFGDKRTAVREAVTAPTGQSVLGDLLLQLIRPGVVRRHAAKAAPIVEKAGDTLLAAQLYLRAGDLEGADRCAYQAASLLRGQHRAIEAVRCINSVADLAAMRGNLSHIRALLMLRGDIQKEIGQVDDALATYKTIVELYRELPADKLLAETYRDLGDLYKMKQDSGSGLEALNQALAIYRDMGEDLELSRTYNNIGNSYFYAGDIAQSFVHYRRALRIQRKLGATPEIASTLSNLGSIYCLKGHYGRSTRLLDISLRLKRELGHAGEIARTLNNLGYVYYLRGLMDGAVGSLTESLEINRRIGSNKEILFNLENLTSVMLDAGQLRESLQYLSEGIELSNSVNDLPHQFVFSHSMAVALLRMGKPEEAARSMHTAFQSMERIDDPQSAFQVRLTSAHLRLFLGDFVGAGRLATEAHEFAMARQLRPYALQAILTLLRISPNETLFNEASELAESLGQLKDKTVGRFNMVERLLESNDYRPDQETLAELGSAAKALPQNIERPRLWNIFAEAMLAAQDIAAAKPLLAQTKLDAKKSGLAPEFAHALILAGRTAMIEGNIEQAYAEYRQALQVLKGISESIANVEDRATFQSKRVVKFLVAEIGRLSNQLNQKQRAGSPALR